MAQIKIDPNALLALADVLGRQQQSLSDLNSIFRSVQSQLDLEISSTSHIESLLSQLRQRDGLQEELLGGLSGSLRQAADVFAACDKRLAGASDDIAAPMLGTRNGPAIGAGIQSTAQQVWMLPELGPYSGMACMFGAATVGTAMTATVDPTKHGAVWETSFGEDGLGTLSVLGYTVEDGNAEAYLGRVTGEEVVNISGDVNSTTKTEVTVGSAHASVSSSAEFWGIEEGAEAKTGFRLKNGEVEELDGSMQSKNKFTLVNVGAGAEVGLTTAAASYETTIGTEDINGTVGGSLRFAELDAGAKAGVKIDEDGFSGALGVEAGATLAEVEGTAKVGIGDFEVGTTVSAEVGLGASAGFAYDDGELDVELGLALGVGGKIKFSVKVPDLGLPWW